MATTNGTEAASKPNVGVFVNPDHSMIPIPCGMTETDVVLIRVMDTGGIAVGR